MQWNERNDEKEKKKKTISEQQHKLRAEQKAYINERSCMATQSQTKWIKVTHKKKTKIEENKQRLENGNKIHTRIAACPMQLNQVFEVANCVPSSVELLWLCRSHVVKPLNSIDNRACVLWCWFSVTISVALKLLLTERQKPTAMYFNVRLPCNFYFLFLFFHQIWIYSVLIELSAVVAKISTLVVLSYLAW